MERFSFVHNWDNQLLDETYPSIHACANGVCCGVLEFVVTEASGLVEICSINKFDENARGVGKALLSYFADNIKNWLGVLHVDLEPMGVINVETLRALAQMGYTEVEGDGLVIIDNRQTLAELFVPRMFMSAEYPVHRLELTAEDPTMMDDNTRNNLPHLTVLMLASMPERES